MLRAVCVLCRSDRRPLRAGVWICKHHWRQLVAIARTLGVAFHNDLRAGDAISRPEIRETLRRLVETDP